MGISPHAAPIALAIPPCLRISVMRACVCVRERVCLYAYVCVRACVCLASSPQLYYRYGAMRQDIYGDEARHIYIHIYIYIYILCVLAYIHTYIYSVCSRACVLPHRIYTAPIAMSKPPWL